MILENNKQLADYKEAGKICQRILTEALLMVRPNVKPIDINTRINDLIRNNKVISWFDKVDDYKHVCSISVNDAWLHGIPNDVPFSIDDVVKIDLGIAYNGLHVDNCWTIVVNNLEVKNPYDHLEHTDQEVTHFLKQSKLRFLNSLDKAIVGNRIGDISNEMYKLEKDDRFFVIREFVGHGIGYLNWEPPPIPCVGVQNTGKKLKKNMVLAVEIMSSMGSSLTTVDDDRWTIRSLDKSITAMFEHTIIVDENKPIVLTYN